MPAPTQSPPQGIDLLPVDVATWPLHCDAILEVERGAFPASMQDDVHDFERLLRAPAAALLVAKSTKSDKAAGYIAGAALEAFPHIPGITNDNSFGLYDTLYVESVAVVPAWRNRGLARALLLTLVRRARQHHITRLTAHVEIGRASYFGQRVTTLTLFQNWYGTERVFQYVEFKLPAEGT